MKSDTSTKVYQDKLLKIRQQFESSETFDKKDLRPVILESWERSRACGLEMNKIKNRVLSQKELESRIEERKSLCDVAFPILSNLYEFTNDSGLLSLVCDEEGYVLKMVGKNFFDFIPSEFILEAGSNRNEKVVGTNGIGTVLENKTPLQVRGLEHYYPTYYDYTCSGAPILAPDGSVAGVLCLAGPSESSGSHTLGLAIAITSIISSEIQIRKHQKILEEAYHEVSLTKNRLDIILEAVASGVLLLDEDFNIVHANKSACSIMLNSKLVGKNFYNFFDKKDISKKDLQAGCESKFVSSEGRKSHIELSMTVELTDEGHYVVFFDTISSLHKKIHNVTGMDAFFKFSDIKGKSKALEQTIAHARVAANSPANVLLLGESGTGKELFAQSIHNASTKKKGPFVAINCGAIPKTLIESELFGYESGSFTGSKREGYAGKFELADGGTIFLDEVGDMPFDVQSTLLRVLENREIVRLGGSRPRQIDVRIIAATNKDLLKGIDDQTFRADLFYRLNVFSINISALRHRHGDIRILAEYFFEKYASRAHNEVLGFRDKALEILEAYHWPGNIRELENIVERAVYLGKGEIGEKCLPEYLLENYYEQTIQKAENFNAYSGKAFSSYDKPDSALEGSGFASPILDYSAPDTPNSILSASPDCFSSPLEAKSYLDPSPKGMAIDQSPVFFIKKPESFGFVARQFKHMSALEQIKKALDLAGGNATKTAELLGISRRTLYRRFEEYNISRDSFS